MRLNVIFLALIFCVCSAYAAQISQDDALSQERVTNLLIFNDVCDVFSPNLSNFFKHDPSEGAIIMDLSMALLENQLVLCTKSLWISLQNLVKIYTDFIEKSESDLIKSFEDEESKIEKANFEKFKFLYEKYGYRKEIKRQKELLLTLDSMYEQLTEELSKISDPLKKIEKAKSLISGFKKELYPEKEEEEWFEEELFVAYILHKIIIASDYICKEVTDDFILFVPKNLVDANVKLNNLNNKILLGGASKAIAKKAIRLSTTNEANAEDMTLGLSYHSLRNYDYKNYLMDDISIYVRAKDLYQASLSNSNNDLGEKLLQALQKLEINKNEQNLGKLPFFNVSINGHGDATMIAEISIESEEETEDQEIKMQNSIKKKSDFLKILDFFKYGVKTKSLAFGSCYPAGQKINKTFSFKNQFDRLNLAQISYPIIFVGSFYATTSTIFSFQRPFVENNPKMYTKKYLYGPSSDVNKDIFSNYFKYLNETPANYEKAADVISGAFDMQNKKIDSDLISNYVSIKYPNTSWFRPVELESDKKLKHAQKISQIEALAHPIMVDEDKKVILLQATMIKTINVLSKSELPVLLPISHDNQNYVIEMMNAPCVVIKDLNDALVKAMLPISTIEEPVNIVIKQLKTRNKTFENVYAFTKRTLMVKENFFTSKETVVAGVIYTDENNVTKIVSWTNNDHDDKKPEILIDRAFSLKKLQEFIAEVEVQAKLDLKDISSVQKMMQEKSEQEIPEKIIKSRKVFEQQEESVKKIQSVGRGMKARKSLVDKLIEDSDVVDSNSATSEGSSDIEPKIEKLDLQA